MKHLITLVVYFVYFSFGEEWYINCGGRNFTDSNSHQWIGSYYFGESFLSADPFQEPTTVATSIYDSVSEGLILVRLPIIEDGYFDVTLHFYEPCDNCGPPFLNPTRSGIFIFFHPENKGLRVFDVLIEGAAKLTDFDILVATRNLSKTAVAKSWTVYACGPSLDILIRPKIRQPVLSGIHVVRNSTMQSIPGNCTESSISSEYLTYRLDSGLDPNFVNNTVWNEVWLAETFVPFSIEYDPNSFFNCWSKDFIDGINDIETLNFYRSQKCVNGTTRYVIYNPIQQCFVISFFFCNTIKRDNINYGNFIFDVNIDGVKLFNISLHRNPFLKPFIYNYTICKSDTFNIELVGKTLVAIAGLKVLPVGPNLLTSGGDLITSGTITTSIISTGLNRILTTSQQEIPSSDSESSPKTSDNKNAFIIIGSTVIVVSLVLIGGFLGVIIIKRKIKKQDEEELELDTLKLNSFAKNIRNEIKILAVAGSGSFGVVYKAIYKREIVAVKQLKLDTTNSQSAREEFLREAKTMKTIPPHKNVVKFIESRTLPEFYLVTEFCEGGSLFEWMKANADHSKDISFLLGIARGVAHLHKHDIIHRDLATRNILLDKELNPKVSDFGMSRSIESSDYGRTKNSLGPVRWMSIEALVNKKYSRASDVWSFGVVIVEIISRELPFQGMSNMEVIEQIVIKKTPHPIPPLTPPVLAEVMKDCFQLEASSRPSFDDLINRL